MKILFCTLLLIMMVALAACGGDDNSAAEPLPTFANTPSQSEATEDASDDAVEIPEESAVTEAPTTAPATDIPAAEEDVEVTDEPAAPPFAGGGNAPPFANTPTGPGGPPIGNAPGNSNGGPPNIGNSAPPPGIGSVAPGGFDNNFAVNISGAITLDMAEGSSSFALTPARDAAGTLIPEHLTLTIFAGELEETQQVVFQFPVTTTPGTYELTGEPIYTGAAITARYDDYDPTTEVFLAFYENLNGTLTISEIGATISGSFTFTADATDPNGNTQTITATGEFAGVVFQG